MRTDLITPMGTGQGRLKLSHALYFLHSAGDLRRKSSSMAPFSLATHCKCSHLTLSRIQNAVTTGFIKTD